MKIIKLNLGKCSYNIIVGNNIIKFLGRYISKLNIGSDAYIISNASIKNRYGKILNKTLRQSGFTLKFKIIPDTEKSKSIQTAYAVIQDLTHYDKKRKVFIIAFGGGVIGDLAGFVASIYKRGIPYIQVPTTLLAQVDSAIGGKTAVDLVEAKNLVGAFYQPRLVFSDTAVLGSLDLRQVRSGLAEVIKYAIIKDKQLFVYLERNYKNILALEQPALEFIVGRCSKIKAKIVEQDEKEEKGIRTILNFGHTIGHALEAATNFKGYNHGEAIALGMLIASQISKSLKLINDSGLKRIERLLEAVGLPTRIKRVTLQAIIEAHYYDKKFIGGKNRLVLIKDIGKTQVLENVPLEIIRGGIKKVIYSS